jgi:acetyltransferase-like isoleucine patch superfamily enzyme
MLDLLKLIKRRLTFFITRSWVRLNNPDCSIDIGVKLNNNTRLLAPSRLHENSSFIASEIGSYSYIGPNSILNNALVGRFCSIGSNVRIIYGRHPSRDFISSSPIFYSSQGQCGSSWLKKNSEVFSEYNLIQERSILIGNDVWIGESALLLEGISIGDGSIIAAGSVVVNDVEPFAIIGGNPAKFIRYRFDSDERQEIADSCWWDAPEEKLRESMNLCSSPSCFIKGIKS